MTTNEPLLQISDLSIQYFQGSQNNYAVSEINLTIAKGESFALVGESGCGKSTVAMSILGLLKKDQTKIEGQIHFKNKSLLDLSERAFADIRGNQVSMIFQDPMTCLNPFLKIGEQLIEQIRRHKKKSHSEARDEALGLLQSVGIINPQLAIEKHPHEFSGGMRQRVMIASALSCNPDLLVADEPTTALDVTIQAQILKLIREETKKRNMSLLLITHDLGVVAGVSDKVAVMYAGKIVEEAKTEDLFQTPKHPYTQGLLQSLPAKENTKEGANKKLYNIPGQPPFNNKKTKICSFYNRCSYRQNECQEKDVDYQLSKENHKYLCLFKDPIVKHQTDANAYQQNLSETQNILEVKDLVVQYPIKSNLLFKNKNFTAVDKVSIQLKKGETLALVGESGCGKSSFIRGVLQLVKPTSGDIIFNQNSIFHCSPSALNATRKKMQIVFQDPYSSLNGRMKIKDIIAEPLKNLTNLNDKEINQRVAELMQETGLQTDWLDRYPHQFSGGQRQRICIARALSPEPEILFCDEPVSALDVSIQAQILNLLQDLKIKRNLSMIFVSHDLAVVRHISDRVAVMYKGKIIEQGATADIFRSPMHPYTQSLIQAAPIADPIHEKEKLNKEITIIDESKDASKGCSYANRCSFSQADCHQNAPDLTNVNDHQVACFHPLTTQDTP